MKNVITLTKTLALALLLVAFTAASASIGGDDSSKCRTKCCKVKKNKEYARAMAELKIVLAEAGNDLKQISTIVAREVGHNIRVVRFTRPVFAFAEATATAETDATFSVRNEALDMEMDAVQEELSRYETGENKSASQKINFGALDQEMNQVQEELSQMDSNLKTDAEKTKKSAEEKTGVKS